MEKITLDEYDLLISDLATPEQTITDYSIVVREGQGKFDWSLVPNPELVEGAVDDYESAMGVANPLARAKRHFRYNRRKLFGSKLPVVVAEGDSWFQFPILIKDTVDHLEDDYLIWCVSAAGDTADNMLMKDNEDKLDYLKALRKRKKEVKAFMLSAAGNDIIGENKISNTAALQEILLDYNGTNDVDSHINFEEMKRKLDKLNEAYQRTINIIRNEPGLEDLPIIIHGYDYVIPYPAADDHRSPIWAEYNEWLGEPLDARKILDTDLRQRILKKLIDELYSFLYQVAGDSAVTHVHVVDCRGSLNNLEDWADEIHGTSEGFGKIADKFRTVLRQVVN